MLKQCLSLLLFCLLPLVLTPLLAAPPLRADLPVLKLAMYHTPPYYYTEDVAEPHGLPLDLLKPAARQLGLQIEIVTCPFARCLKLAEQGEVDIVGGLIKTDERENYLYFIQPAMMNFVSSFVFYSRHSQNHEIHSVKNLKGYSITVMRNAAYFPAFDQATDFERISVNSEAKALELVYKGRADYAITVEQTAEGAFAEAGLELSDLKRQPYHVNQNIRGYLAFSRQSPNFQLAAKLEQILEQQYRAGMFHLLWQKYRLPAIPNQAQTPATEPLTTTPAE
jgi:polar amino acid transport system substrate-binding protein